MSLSFEDRKKTILKTLERDGKVQVRELAEILQVSGETIRRDLDKLEKEGMLRKVYGGAVKEKTSSWDKPFEQRAAMNEKEKRSLCKAAAELVEDGDSIMIGYGTTTLEIVRFLADKQNVTIITQSIPVLLLALEVFKGRIIFIGGEVERVQKSAVGPLAERMLERLKTNKVFISASGISMSDGITDYDLDGANISRKMMERAEEVIVLADHTKFGKTDFAYICPLVDASMIITDKSCSEEWKKILAEKEIELLIAEDM
ncbi:DeoR family transcriptional regulator [Brevibacillus agri]|uniref:DeoR family transcriptional regulator n=2 Tax=Bacillota TaxID=1239 RepID=A0A3M8ASZ6_9BACL|nr:MULTISPECIES: DeoR/GlpR family DNA-binding transcription regulator [Brevibacillus]ELK42823.1 DeoR family transcriptional regulator [Brevibacillus agri BAB-2500]EJL40204.1 transcriptional regulator of sugar metabolism [Brevibacillus sp. CF112]MBG9566277.1 DeoR family transcriptional regulator [Brevibacillus agri]MCG5253366.1 DeoR/GlpR family DNA-binding transcription regulator [Brevibacillus agri]MDN4094977.1 DeoR/GlpR family DNA-binding transcription regulator [Brevibacillus agri]